MSKKKGIVLGSVFLCGAVSVFIRKRRNEVLTFPASGFNIVNPLLLEQIASETVTLETFWQTILSGFFQKRNPFFISEGLKRLKLNYRLNYGVVLNASFAKRASYEKNQPMHTITIEVITANSNTYVGSLEKLIGKDAVYDNNYLYPLPFQYLRRGDAVFESNEDGLRFFFRRLKKIPVLSYPLPIAYTLPTALQNGTVFFVIGSTLFLLPLPGSWARPPSAIL